MVYVKLAQDWTDPSGAQHPAGTMVDVDAATLAELEADGTVTEPRPGGGGDSGIDWPEPS